MSKIEDIVFTIVISLLMLMVTVMLVIAMVGCPFPGVIAFGVLLLGLFYIYYMGIKIVWFE